MEIDQDVKKGLGIESLLDDSVGGPDVATSKLSDAAALAESFQPKGNTLESTKVLLLCLSLVLYHLLFIFKRPILKRNKSVCFI